MKFSTSVNIERDNTKELNYIVTANSKRVVGKIIDSFSSGIHSFCLIGSYGTGKSSFILALENCLTKKNNQLFNYKGQFNNFTNFEFVNIVGDYTSLVDLVKPRLNEDNSRNFFIAFENFYQKIQSQNKFLVLVIDEFGKVLEHAAKNNPEKEMYFLQKFCEFINDTDKNIILLTTLHQGFSAYAKDLKLEQKQEWVKVKGRIQDIVFKEPIEQLLNLAAETISAKKEGKASKSENQLYQLAIDSKFTNTNLKQSVADALYPMDVFSAYVLTMANQRYGQNERTLFTFLESTGTGSLADFTAKENYLYNLSLVHDYIVYNFHSYLSEANEDSTNWSAIKMAIERVEGLNLSSDQIIKAVALVKVIGLLNIFASSTTIIDDNFLNIYARITMGIDDVQQIIKSLSAAKIVRFASYKSKYILFEGTDVDIETGLYNASIECQPSKDFVDELKKYFDLKVSIANAHYYRTGTPRYFEYQISNFPITKLNYGETDGLINLVFVTNKDFEKTKQLCLEQHDIAIEYCLFKNSDSIIEHLFEIDKLKWVRDIYIADETDKVANREIENLISYEKSLLNKYLTDSLYSDNVECIFNGEIIKQNNQQDLLRNLSIISDCIYHSTPVFKNEMLNKHKPNGNLSFARQNFLIALLENENKKDLGFEDDAFPPEKTIYYTLLKNTGIHREEDGIYTMNEPTEPTFKVLWNVSESFLKSTMLKQRKIGDLITELQEPPFRLKQGLIDCWIPAFLIIRKEDFALYSGDKYIPNFNRDVLELFLRNPNNFSIKAFSIDGIKYSFFEKYRSAINLRETELKSQSFYETIKPFFVFYNKLNTYARTTNDVSINAKKFRNVICRATDPEKTFFETLPEELGFKEVVVSQNPESIESFVDVLRGTIKDLQACYDDFIFQIEKKILTSLKISQKEYLDYKQIVDKRYKSVKVDLMPMDVRNFHARFIGKYSDYKSWIESICYVILNKSLENIKDSEKSFLFSSLQDKLFQLDDYVEMHKSSDESIVRLHITQNKSEAITKQVLVPKEKEKDIFELENKLESLLSSDESINMAALIKLLEKKIK